MPQFPSTPPLEPPRGEHDAPVLPSVERFLLVLARLVLAALLFVLAGVTGLFGLWTLCDEGSLCSGADVPVGLAWLGTSGTSLGTAVWSALVVVRVRHLPWFVLCGLVVAGLVGVAASAG